MNKKEKSKLHRFINDNEFRTTFIGGGAEREVPVVDAQKLRRLIRRMNDQFEPIKVKVPAFVVKLVTEYREKYSDITFYGFVKQCSVEGFGNNESPEGHVTSWLTRTKENESILMRVWLDEGGYEVEEQLYYLKLIDKPIDKDESYLVYEIEKDRYFLDHPSPNNRKYKMQFTEKEIKSIDEGYWTFAVPVEKV